MKKLDLVGKRYGMLEVVSETERPAHVKRKGSFWLCQCDCGNQTIVEGSNLGVRTSSCGCKRKEAMLNNRKHKTTINSGLSKTRLYYIWNSMKQRCHNHKSKDYRHYGLRGIRVCDDWRNNFTSFRDWAISNGYTDELTIDRIDVNGNYEPLNCRWVTMAEQNRNKRKKEE